MGENEGYWEGATWVYHSRIANEVGQGASDITWLVIPGAGNEFEMLYFDLHNADTATRVATSVIETDTAGERVATFQTGINVTADGHFAGPFADTDNATSAGVRFIVSGTMRLLFTLAAVADGQDAVLGLACRIRGGLPTVTEGGAGTIVITELDERVY